METVPVRQAALKERYELSPGQEELWFLWKKNLHPGISIEPCQIHITGSLDIPLFQKAVAEIIKRHPALRTRFGEFDGVPMQTVYEYMDYELPVFHLDRCGKEAAAEKLQKIQSEVLSTGFRLTVGPLYRFFLVKWNKDEYYFYSYIHHIVYDGSSFAIFCRELTEIYSSWKSGKAYLLRQPVPYREAVYKQTLQWHSSTYQSAKDYWLERLKPPIKHALLPSDFPRAVIPRLSGRVLKKTMPSDLVQQLRKQAIEVKSSLFRVMLSIYVLWLQQKTGLTDIIVGIPIDMRGKTYPLFGYCVNSVPIRVQTGEEPSFTEVLSQVDQRVEEAMKHQAYPSAHLRRALNLPSMPYTTVFNLIRIPPMRVPNMTWNASGNILRTYVFDLSWRVMRQQNAALWLEVDYNAELFTEASVVGFIEEYMSLLQEHIPVEGESK